jgi:hypothetical protein
MTLQGFEVRAAKPKGERAAEDEPVQQPIRAGEKSPADRRNLTNDERTVKRRRRRVHAAFSTPGYYLVDKDAAPQSGRFETMSEAEAQLQPDSGQLIQYLDQAPNASHIAEPFPPNLNQVNGSLRMSAHTDDEFLFLAAEEGEEDEGEAEPEEEEHPDCTHCRHSFSAHGSVMGGPCNVCDCEHYDDEEAEGGESEGGEGKEASLHVREGQLLGAMAKATGPEQQRLMGELEGLRRHARRQVLADREIDLANAFIRDTLTPVRVYEHHTAATDWIEDVAEPDLGVAAVHRAMVVEALEWAKKVSPAVKEDREEYLEQARGMARITASAMGPHRELAFQTFMRTAVDGDQGAPEQMALPWSAPPMVLPPTGGGNAPFGVPQGGAPLNGQNFNEMATEVYPGSQVLPLDNGASAWPPADNLEGEEPLPPVAPDNYNAVGADTHMSSLHTADAKGYSPRSGMGGGDEGKAWRATHTYDPIGWDAFDARPHPGSKAITPGVPVMNHGYMSPRGPGGMRLVHVSDEAGNHQTVDSRSLGSPQPLDAPGPREGSRRNAAYPSQDYGDTMADTDAAIHDDDFDREQDEDIQQRNEERRQPYEWDPKRREGSQAFNGPKQSYAEYQARLSEESEPMDQEHWAGSMAAVTPAPSNTSIPVTSMLHWGERGIDPDPQGQQLAGNPMAGYPAGGDWDKDEAHAQSGMAQSDLPLAPEGPNVTQHLDFLTDFPDTGPGEVPSDRAWNIDANESEEGHSSGVTHGAAMTSFDMDPGYAGEGDWDDNLGTDRYMSEIPHDFESSGGSQYCRHCGEAKRHPMHVLASRLAAGKPFEPDRDSYSTTPGGQAQNTEQYEQAYSSGREIDYSQTGIGELGTVPVQGYGANPNGEMFVWQMAPGGVPVGAANVADVPTPGAATAPGMGQPDDLNNPEAPEGRQARLRAIQRRIRTNLGAQP